MNPTPLERAPGALSGGRDVWLKREDGHELGVFKWRGALPVLEDWRSDVVTASTGNHGAATAWAAHRVGVRATVFVPEEVAAAKLELLLRWGADIRRVGDDLDEAKDAARAFADEQGLPFFEDGAESAQFDGYEAIGWEILGQIDPAAVVIPVGNGALAIGVGRAIGANAKRVGVAAKEAPVMWESWHAGEVVESDRSATVADGLAVRVAIPSAVEAMREAVDDMLLVSEREIAAALVAFEDAGIRVEGSAAAALAALAQIESDGPVVLIVTGRNVNDALLRRAREDPGSFPD